MPAGRPRKPSSLRLIEGNRGHRPLPKGEPQPRGGAPEMPEHLPPLAQLAWTRAVREMNAVAGWLTQVDWRILESWATDYAIWRDCVAAVKEHGLTYMDSFMDSSGQEHLKPKARPELKTLNDAAVRMLKAESALGFAPAFRARIDLSGREDATDDVLDA